MRISLYYALRELRRRPKDFVTLVIIASSVLIILMLLFLWMQTQWLNDVLPDNEFNYHFCLKDLTETEMKEIESMDCVQAVHRITDQNGNLVEFCVRITWEESLRYHRIMLDLLDDYNLWERPSYERFNSREGKQEFQHYRIDVKRSFVTDVNTPYIMHPETITLLELFCAFFGSAFTLLIHERYRRNMPEYGSLRTIGFTRAHLYQINIIETMMILITALPISTSITILFTRIFSHATVNVANPFDVAYSKLFESVPMVEIVIIFLLMTLSAAAGTIIVCNLLRKTEILDLIRGLRAYTISFVSKTSSFFERARSIGIYSYLYLFRTRIRTLLNAAAIAIMLPLPIYFLMMWVEMYQYDRHSLITYYMTVEVILLLLITSAVLFIMSTYSIRGRKSEFSIFRAQGASKRTIYKMVLPEIIGFGIILSLIVGFICNEVFLNIAYAQRSRPALPFSVYLLQPLVYSVAVLLYSLPFQLSGAILTPRGILRGSIISNIREVE